MDKKLLIVGSGSEPEPEPEPEPEQQQKQDLKQTSWPGRCVGCRYSESIPNPADVLSDAGFVLVCRALPPVYQAQEVESPIRGRKKIQFVLDGRLVRAEDGCALFEPEGS